MKSRYVCTGFWTDSYIESLDPIEKLLFLYLLTNPQTNIAGIYEISIRKMAFETGIDKDMIQKVLERFQEAGKIFHIEGFVILPNFGKYQNAGSSQVQAGVKRILKNEVPDKVHRGMDTLSIPYPYPNIYSYSDLDSDLDSNLDLDSDAPEAPLPDDTLQEFEPGVFLTRKQHRKLVKDFGSAAVNGKLLHASTYIAEHPGKYKSHYCAVLNWLKKDHQNGVPDDTEQDRLLAEAEETAERYG